MQYTSNTITLNEAKSWYITLFNETDENLAMIMLSFSLEATPKYLGLPEPLFTE